MRMKEKCMVMLMAILTMACFVQAGPLEPIAPPASTMKTLTEVEPRTIINATNTPGDASNSFIINESGSYYLVASLVGEATKNGILIDANDVVIDLNGFSLTGVPSSGKGIDVQGQYTNLVIKKGFVNNWGSVGINLRNETILGSSFVNQSTLRNLHISNNGSNGIYAADSAMIIDCLVTNNGNFGIITSAGSTIQHCIVQNNNSVGIRPGKGALVSDCVVTGNGATGIEAFSGEAVVRHCNVNGNGNFGIRTGTHSSIIECTVKNNDDDGITVSQNCLVLNNNCTSNGSNAGADAAGIRASSSGNRIEGNNCVGNDRGIEVSIAGSVILKNTASGNGTNYSIAASNAFGPLVNVAGVGDITATANADHPWANFEY